MTHTRLSVLCLACSFVGFPAVVSCVSKGDTNIDTNQPGGSTGGTGARTGEELEAGQSSSGDTGGTETGGRANRGGTSSGGAGASGSGGHYEPDAGGTSTEGGSAGSTDTEEGGTDGVDNPPAGDCGGVDQPCCSDSCDEGLACLGGSSCSCAAKAMGEHVIRGDGSVVFVSSPAKGGSIVEILTEDAEPLVDVVDVSAGVRHSCGLLGDGTVWCWRLAPAGNDNGQLGSGEIDTSGPEFRATQVMIGSNAPLQDVKSLSSGYAYSTCAVTNAGGLYCWGDLAYLANGGTALSVPYAQPILNGEGEELSGVVQASVGAYDSCALINEGGGNEVWCWGLNRSKNLGQGDDKPQRYPVRVPGFDDPVKVVVAISVYLWNTTVCALDGDGVRCLGFNSNGQVGNGTMTDTAVAAPDVVQLESGNPLDEVVDLQSGVDVCALRANGTIWCWGRSNGEYAVRVGANNVASLAGDDGDFAQHVPRYLTTDGVYHTGTTAHQVECR